jgi:hypothetical protein
VAGFRPFFNPATGEWIEYTTVAEDTSGALVRFNWHSAAGGSAWEEMIMTAIKIGGEEVAGQYRLGLGAQEL